MLKYLFFGVFAACGIGIFAFFSVPTIIDWSDAKSWQATQGYIQSTELEASRSDDTTVYQTTARYTYDFDGVSHQGQRVGFSGGSDNIGSYHQDWYATLKNHQQDRSPITVWVNPDNPRQAVIDRELRWGLILFQSLFLVLFGGVGVIGIICSYIADKNAKPLANNDSNSPWLSYREWHQATILSNTKLATRFLLGFAIIWNLISWAIAIAALADAYKGNHLALIALLFPAAGLMLIYFWYRARKSYRITGKMPLTLMPYPASIGGQFGGVITPEIPLSTLPNDTEVCLECYETYRSNKNTRERSLWKETRTAYWQNESSDQRIMFYFDLANDLPLPDIPSIPNGKQWRLRLSATLADGTAIEREYVNLPVFNTQQSSPLADDVEALAQSPAARRQRRNLVDSALTIKLGGNGYEMSYPAYQHITRLIWALLGTIFIFVGAIIPSLIFNIIFLLLGGIVFISSLVWFGSSLTVRLGQEGITANRTVFGVTRKPLFIPSYGFKQFAIKKAYSKADGVKRVSDYYSIEAEANDGKKITVAKDLKGIVRAQAAVDKLNELVHY